MPMLIAASNGAPHVAYGLRVWIGYACDWELNRRAGCDYELLPPEAAIDPSEDAVGVNAAIVLRDQFAEVSPDCKPSNPHSGLAFPHRSGACDGSSLEACTTPARVASAGPRTPARQGRHRTTLNASHLIADGLCPTDSG